MAAFADELSDKPLARTLLNEPVVLFRQADGSPVALEDSCCHRRRLVFNAAGRCVHVPGQDTIPKAACVVSYPLAELDGLIWLWAGDPALADVGKVGV